MDPLSPPSGRSRCPATGQETFRSLRGLHAGAPHSSGFLPEAGRPVGSKRRSAAALRPPGRPGPVHPDPASLPVSCGRRGSPITRDGCEPVAGIPWPGAGLPGLARRITDEAGFQTSGGRTTASLPCGWAADASEAAHEHGVAMAEADGGGRLPGERLRAHRFCRLRRSRCRGRTGSSGAGPVGSAGGPPVREEPGAAGAGIEALQRNPESRERVGGERGQKEAAARRLMAGFRGGSREGGVPSSCRRRKSAWKNGPARRSGVPVRGPHGPGVPGARRRRSRRG